MGILVKFKGWLLWSVLVIGWSGHAQAAIVNVTVTFQNLAPTNSVSFAPLRVGFNKMVIPSNDLFIGNDNPAAFQILDTAGNLLISQINQTASQIWDANSEVAIAANAAFVAGGVNGNRVDEGGTVAFDFSELNVFNGLTTGAGYVFNNSLIGSTNIGLISFSVTAVPEPSSMALIGIGAVVRRFLRKAAKV